eukprot:COSAG01_NODE_635_length_14662_cov_12.488773_2_plen_117_part_00
MADVLACRSSTAVVLASYEIQQPYWPPSYCTSSCRAVHAAALLAGTTSVAQLRAGHGVPRWRRRMMAGRDVGLRTPQGWGVQRPRAGSWMAVYRPSCAWHAEPCERRDGTWLSVCA